MQLPASDRPTTTRFGRPAARAALREWFTLALLLSIFSGALGWSGGLGRADQALYDAAINLMPRAPAPDVTIAAIDQSSLARNGAIERAGPWANAAFSSVPVAALMVALLLLAPRRGLPCAGLMLLLTLAASFLLLRVAGLWFAPVAALAGLLLAYPLWRWRRLEATLRTLGAALVRLDTEPRIPADARPGDGRRGGDPVEQCFLALEAAAVRLRAARRFASDILESLPDAALVADREGRVLLANRAAARLLGAAAAEQLGGRRLADLIQTFTLKADPTQAPTWEQLRALAPHPVEPGEAASIELASPAGGDLLARCAACAGTSADGAAPGWIVSLVDISPLRQAEGSRDEVLAFLSHDLRSPQSSILALLELHELDPGDNPKEAVHERIAHYARRTLELSERFLQLARADFKDYEIETIDLGSIAEEAIEEVWAAAEQKRITLKLHFDGEPVPVKADPSLLRRALINLLANAVKYSPADSTTLIRVDAGEDWAQCQVIDQGQGMDADHLARLFTRLRRFSRPGQPKARGAGLGMAFVKTVVDRHGGRILAESAPGAGSTITVQLPPAAD